MGYNQFSIINYITFTVTSLLNNMKKLILSIFVLITVINVNAQTEKAIKIKGEKFSRNAFYIDILGNSLPIAFSYDHYWTKNGFLNISTSIGGMYLPFNNFPTANGTAEINLLFGKGRNMFEYSIGLTYAYLDYSSESFSGTYHLLNNTLRLGYRYQKPEGGFFFRGGIIVHMNKALLSDDLIETVVWNLFIREHITITLPGISVGYCF